MKPRAGDCAIDWIEGVTAEVFCNSQEVIGIDCQAIGSHSPPPEQSPVSSWEHLSSPSLRQLQQ